MASSSRSSSSLEPIHASCSFNSRAYVASFIFRGAEQQKSIGTLSGGERNRVHLAKLLKSGPT